MSDGWLGDSDEFHLRPADLLPHKVGFFLKYYQSFLEHARRWINDEDAIRVIENIDYADGIVIGELVFTEQYPEATTARQATNLVVDYAIEEFRCNDAAMLNAILDVELF